MDVGLVILLTYGTELNIKPCMLQVGYKEFSILVVSDPYVDTMSKPMIYFGMASMVDLSILD